MCVYIFGREGFVFVNEDDDGVVVRLGGQVLCLPI